MLDTVYVKDKKYFYRKYKNTDGCDTQFDANTDGAIE